jgi:hypothetical protein
MKKINYLVLAVMLAAGCGKEEKLAFEEQVYTSEPCSDCPEISVQIPQALDNRKVSKSVNNALIEEVISLLAYDEEEEVNDINAALLSFKNGFRKLQDEFPDETIPWEANINAEITYENKDLLSIGLTSYIFTGGAHGYGSTRFLNFEKGSGRELESKDLFKNRKKFIEFAESQFRIQQNIPPDNAINSTGFMFEQNEFYLPENIGFTETGLKLLYNPYEVASYADGAIELTIPYKEIRRYLATGY